MYCMVNSFFTLAYSWDSHDKLICSLIPHPILPLSPPCTCTADTNQSRTRGEVVSLVPTLAVVKKRIFFSPVEMLAYDISLAHE